MAAHLWQILDMVTGQVEHAKQHGAEKYDDATTFAEEKYGDAQGYVHEKYDAASGKYADAAGKVDKKKAEAEAARARAHSGWGRHPARGSPPRQAGICMGAEAECRDIPAAAGGRS